MFFLRASSEEEPEQLSVSIRKTAEPPLQPLGDEKLLEALTRAVASLRLVWPAEPRAAVLGTGKLDELDLPFLSDLHPVDWERPIGYPLPQGHEEAQTCMATEVSVLGPAGGSVGAVCLTVQTTGGSPVNYLTLNTVFLLAISCLRRIGDLQTLCPPAWTLNQTG